MIEEICKERSLVARAETQEEAAMLLETMRSEGLENVRITVETHDGDDGDGPCLTCVSSDTTETP